MYRLSAFYFARSASDLPFEATPSIFIFIIYFMVMLGTPYCEVYWCLREHVLALKHRDGCKVATNTL